jgi:two-component system sensor histidine kinase PhoQ
MNQSLTNRLFISAGIVIFLFLGGILLLLDQAFSISLENIVREKLKLHIYSLLAAADNDHGVILLPDLMLEQRFNSEKESLIGIVTNPEKTEYWRSISAQDQHFSLPSPEPGRWLFGRAQDESGKTYFVSSYSTIWPDDMGRKSTFVFTVMEAVNYYQEDLTRQRVAIFAALTVVGIVLLGLQAIIFHWGLSPVRRLANEVDAMGNGERSAFQDDYPRELQPLVVNLNLLIDNERRQREKYRERMADLSHSLKTPLSVLKGFGADVAASDLRADRLNLVKDIGEQINKMSNIVDYQLRRAVSSGQNISFVAIALAPEVENVLAALDKVYADKQVLAELQIDSSISIFADEGDLAEVLGNILDNAYKHCKEKVMTTAAHVVLADGHSGIRLVVEDDGLGIPKKKRRDILKRGVRLDSAHAGQGFGLSIVANIVNSYKGVINVDDSPMGGARFTIDFPTH